MTNLRRYRQAYRLTQKELATLLGISQSRLSVIESGDEMPSLRVAQKIEHLTQGIVPCSEWEERAP